MSATSGQVRRAGEPDIAALVHLRAALYRSPSDVAGLLTLLGKPDAAHFVSVGADGGIVGFAEVSLRRDYVNGCETSPVAFLEGIYVEPDARRRGVARMLVAAVAEWGRAQRCAELGSDALLDNPASHAMHAALGFVETERVVFFRRRL